MSYKEALILKSVTIGKSVISIDLVVTKDVSDGKWNLDKNERYGLRKFCYIGGNFMSKLFQINSGIVGSTGTIMLEIDKYAKNEGMETYMASVNNKSSQKDYPSNHIVIGSILEKHVHRKMAAITGNEACK